MRDPKERLQDIIEAIDQIMRYAASGREKFERDELIQNWFLRHLQIIGEAAYRVPDEVKAQTPNIPWAKIIGMRHILVHDYFQIDTEVVWEVVEKDLPVLRRDIESLLKKME
jgi:uncharacterized protein with HEPN domain